MSFKNMFRLNYDIHPHMHTRRASNIYTDIPKKYSKAAEQMNGNVRRA